MARDYTSRRSPYRAATEEKTTDKPKRRLKTLDNYVLFSLSVLVVYAVVERYLTYKTGISADTLTTCVFGCLGGEVLSCCLIKIFKLREEEH